MVDTIEFLNSLGPRKQFDYQLYMRHDPPSRKIIKAYFASRNVIVEDNVDECAVDLVVKSGNRTGYLLEIEHRNYMWTTMFTYPFKIVHVMARRYYTFKNDVENKIYFFTISQDYSHFAYSSTKYLMHHLIQENLEELKPSKKVAPGECAFNVPLDAFRWEKI